MLDVVTCLMWSMEMVGIRDTGYIGHKLKGYGLLKSPPPPLQTGQILYMRANIPKL